jgi:hypothetical protein
LNSEYPSHFYKYREIKKFNCLAEDNSIKGLIGNIAVFSNRKNFNDLFDSKVDLVPPSEEELIELDEMLSKLRCNSFDGKLSSGKPIPTSKELKSEVTQEFNSLLDDYPFFCVATNPKNNLMWSHYAGSHSGFCIEFKSTHVKASKVTYQDTIPKIQMMDLIRLKFNPNTQGTLVDVWASLRTKLLEWEYENEYRFQADNSMKGGRIPKGEKFILIPYSQDFVEAVIFGCRMPPEAKSYILNNMPKNMKYKQAIESLSSIELVDFDSDIHS